MSVVETDEMIIAISKLITLFVVEFKKPGGSMEALFRVASAISGDPDYALAIKGASQIIPELKGLGSNPDDVVSIIEALIKEGMKTYKVIKTPPLSIA